MSNTRNTSDKHNHKSISQSGGTTTAFREEHETISQSGGTTTALREEHETISKPERATTTPREEYNYIGKILPLRNEQDTRKIVYAHDNDLNQDGIVILEQGETLLFTIVDETLTEIDYILFHLPEILAQSTPSYQKNNPERLIRIKAAGRAYREASRKGGKA